VYDAAPHLHCHFPYLSPSLPLFFPLIHVR
jgi:hypothetical protein